MATPKRKTSVRRKGIRRSHHRVTVPAFDRDPNTGEVTLRHRVSATGTYRGKQVTTVKVKSKDKKSEK